MSPRVTQSEHRYHRQRDFASHAFAHPDVFFFVLTIPRQSRTDVVFRESLH